MSEHPIVEAVKADPVVKAVIESGTPGAMEPRTVTTQTGDIVATPTSTEEEDRTTAGQRAINVVWENTQRQIALTVIGSATAVGAGLAALGSPDAQVAAFVFLYGAANLVIGFYFGRTNHQRIGGITLGR